MSLVHKAKQTSFKLLLTCPGETYFQGEYGIREKEVLLLNEEQLDDDGQGYNDGMFEKEMAALIARNEEDHFD